MCVSWVEGGGGCLRWQWVQLVSCVSVQRSPRQLLSGECPHISTFAVSPHSFHFYTVTSASQCAYSRSGACCLYFVFSFFKYCCDLNIFISVAVRFRHISGIYSNKFVYFQL